MVTGDHIKKIVKILLNDKSEINKEYLLKFIF